MTQKDVIEQLIPLFQEVFDDDELIINENTTAQDVKGWDSAPHIHLILAIEQQLNRELLPSEIAKRQQVGDLTDLISTKLQLSH